MSGKIFREAAAPIHNGPLRRSTAHTSAATNSGWTLPLAADQISTDPMRDAAATPVRVRCRSSGTVAAIDDATRTADHATPTTTLGTKVNGTQSHANHGAYL